MNPRRWFYDPFFWSILVINLGLLGYLMMHPEKRGTVIYIYWAQSVMIGMFTVLRILLMDKAESGMTGKSGETIENTLGMRVFLVGFFMVHYGIFHVVYLVFVMVAKLVDGRFDGPWFFSALAAFLVEGLASFVYSATRGELRGGNVGNTMFRPYIRIIPMHLAIVLGIFLFKDKASSGGFYIFMVLKIITDQVMYVVSKKTEKSMPAG